ncbi:hypothetical protein [Lysinibacillus sp. LZ02]|uniref:hypothetical protein n=1 Tax=Lysinibacillus sp. LZ02 TaxID=3420668 RepID=UPI003D35B3B0
MDKEAFEDSSIKGALAKYGITSYKVECTLEHVSVLSQGKTVDGLKIAFCDYTEGHYAWELDHIKVLD